MNDINDYINKTFCMDNLEFMKSLPNESIDLIYGDILYGTGNKFTDYQDLKADRETIKEFYIPRIKEMHKLLKSTGSIYLQMDWRISHWIRYICDDIFGYENFINEIIWHYQTYQGKNKKSFPRKHDNILYYSKSDTYTFKLLKDTNYEDTIDYKRWRKYLNNNNEILGCNYPKTDCRFDGYYNRFVKVNRRIPNDNDVIFKIEGKTIDSVWNIKAVDPKSYNIVNYNTQKPKELLERIIKASSNESDIIGDFFCGSGATGVVAKELNRKYILCDINPKAIEITNLRLTS